MLERLRSNRVLIDLQGKDSRTPLSNIDATRSLLTQVGLDVRISLFFDMLG